jgi:hypothetical protein
MDVNALDPHFDQTEEAAQFFTVFADAVSRRNDSFDLDWTFQRARSPDGIGYHSRHSRNALMMRPVRARSIPILASTILVAMMLASRSAVQG